MFLHGRRTAADWHSSATRICRDPAGFAEMEQTTAPGIFNMIKNKFVLLVALGLSAVIFTGCHGPAGSHSSADGAGAFASGRYRNLFTEAGHSRKDVRRKIDGAFQQLFHGDPNTQ